MNADPMDPETAELLLGGFTVDESAGTRPVALLLTAVRAAPRPGELAGLGHAVRGFRHAQAQRHRRLPLSVAAGETEPSGTAAADVSPEGESSAI